MAVKNFVVKNGLDTPALKITGLGSVTVTGYLTRASDGTVGSTATIPNSGLTNSAVTIGSTTISLGSSSATLAGLTSVAATTFTGNLTGAVTGNASTATALQTARTINGVSFDGTANITVTAAAGTLTGSTLAAGVTGSSLTSVGTLSNLTVTNTIVGTIQKTQNIVGGNSTTLLGSIPYQSNTDTTTLLSPNTTTTKQFLSQTGTGTNGAIPTWAAIANGDVPTALTGKTYNGLTLTAAATGFTIAGGTTSKTLTVSNTLTLAGTDSSTLNIGAGGTLGSAAFTASTAYLSSSTSSVQDGYFGNVGLRDDTASSHYLILTSNEDLTANRTLSIDVDDTSRTIAIRANLDFTGAGTGQVDFGSGGTVSYSTHTHAGSAITSGTVSATYIDSAIARLASPTFTGTVTMGLLKQAGGTSEFVSAGNNGVTGEYTLQASDEGKIVEIDGTAVTIRLDNITPTVGAKFNFINLQSTSTAQFSTSNVTIRSTPGNKFRAQYSMATAIYKGSATWYVSGDLAP